MGTAYPSAQFASPDGQGVIFSITAKITWDDNYRVTVESVWSDELSDSEFGWRIKGRASQGDTNTYAEKYVNSSFQGTANKEYILQGCCTGGVYDNSGGNCVFKLTSNSSTGGDSGGNTGGDSGGNTGGGSWGGTYPGSGYLQYLEYMLASGCIYVFGTGLKSLTVNRVWSSNGHTGEIGHGDRVYYGDILDISVTAQDGYILDNAYILDGEIVEFNSMNLSAMTYNGQVYFTPTEPNTGVIINAMASLRHGSLEINAELGSSVTVRRIQSPIGHAALGEVNASSTIYYGDVLEITATASEGYEISSIIARGCTENSDGTFTVTSTYSMVNVIVDTELLNSGSGSSGSTGGMSCSIYIDNGTSWVKCTL